MLNNEKIEAPYEEIFGKEIKNQKRIFERFKKNLEKIENKKTIIHHGILKSDPLYDFTVMEIN